MRGLGNVFRPEKSPIHNRFVSIASEVTFTNDAQLESEMELRGGILLAGKTLASKLAGETIEESPITGVLLRPDATHKASGILMHDVVLEKGRLAYPIGVLVQGVVYDDVVKDANIATEITDEIVGQLEEAGVVFYGVKTK